MLKCIDPVFGESFENIVNKDQDLLALIEERNATPEEQILKYSHMNMTNNLVERSFSVLRRILHEHKRSIKAPNYFSLICLKINRK